ncbi:hypothetical protein P7L68_19405 [Tistrella mobilis]|uniref:hypothetical protein n=1 Tax=Tistrella mobilis TaxID=171437 RepID=UPI003557B827
MSTIENTIDLTPLVGPVLELVAAAVTGLVGAALKRWLGLKSANEIRAYVDVAAQNAAKIGKKRALEKFGHLDDVTVHNAALDFGLRYMVELVPDGLRYLKITPEKVRDLVEARMS